jgi:hypothetical protein
MGPGYDIAFDGIDDEDDEWELALRGGTARPLTMEWLAPGRTVHLPHMVMRCGMVRNGPRHLAKGKGNSS